MGCPRSGTTLLQSMLAAHPQIASFPESHFFSKLRSSKCWWRALGMASHRARPRLLAFLREIGRDDMLAELPGSFASARQLAGSFVRILDGLTEKQGKRIWVEKTPSHVRCISLIERMTPEPKFIHLLRCGADVVASLYEVTRRYPEAWGGPRDIDRCIDRWIEDVRISREYQDRPNHVVVTYEELVRGPRPLLTRLCGFAGVEFSDLMLREYAKAAAQVTHEHEAWKASTRDAIRNANGKKFYEVFDESQQRYVLERLEEAGAGDAFPR